MAHEEVVDQGCPERADIFSYDEMAIAELFYTSGSTGAPKGVTLSHRTLYLHALSVALEYRDPETMVDLHTIPLFHANGWGHPHASTMMGIKQVMVRRFEPVAGVPAHPGTQGDQHVPGPDHGQRADQLRRIATSGIYPA